MTLVSRMRVQPVTPGWVRYLDHRQPGETPHPVDDFFSGVGLAAAWSEIEVSGTVTPTVDRGLLSLVGEGGTANDMQGVAKALGLSAPVTVETSTRILASTDTGTGMVGVGFVDGLTGSDNIYASRYWGDSGDVATFQGTLTSVDSGGTTIFTRGPFTVHDRIYLRAIWKSANTFTTQVSVDGVSWRDFGLGDRSKTMTPTHVCLFSLDWGAGEPALASYDYLRVYEADLST